MTQSATMEEFEALLKDSFETDTPKEGSVVKVSWLTKKNLI